MTQTLAQQWTAAQTAARTAAETDRHVRRLYGLAYTVRPIGDMLANPNTTADTLAYATARIPVPCPPPSASWPCPASPTTRQPPTR
ncbi:hypothetical protein [Streptomyces sp. 8N706]|uniref:hypothetical protein n=1 Tax=Streptomyces sp. 8N706 TaxID=3457416 RepID=UPI003FD3A6EE